MKKNLSSCQQNRIHELAFQIDSYIQKYDPHSYEKFYMNDGNPRKGDYALKDAVYKILKGIYLPSSETTEGLIKLWLYFYEERKIAGKQILLGTRNRKIGRMYCEVSAILIQLSSMFTEQN